MALTTSTVQPPHSVAGILEKKHMKTGDDFLRMTKSCVLTIASNQHVLKKLPTPMLPVVFLVGFTGFWSFSSDCGLFPRISILLFSLLHELFNQRMKTRCRMTTLQIYIDLP